MRTAILLAALALATPATAQAPTRPPAQPLGISKGMTIKELLAKGGKPHPKQKGLFRFDSTPFPGLKDMRVVATPKTGACKVSAFTELFESNRAGKQVRERFEQLVSRLTERYGAPSSTYDYVRSGALWKEDDEFMMALTKEERVLSTYWTTQGKNPVVLPEGIAAIEVEAKPPSSSRAGIVVAYDFDNIDECVDELKADENQAL